MYGFVCILLSRSVHFRHQAIGLYQNTLNRDGEKRGKNDENKNSTNNITNRNTYIRNSLLVQYPSVFNTRINFLFRCACVRADLCVSVFFYGKCQSLYAALFFSFCFRLFCSSTHIRKHTGLIWFVCLPFTIDLSYFTLFSPEHSRKKEILWCV